VTRDLNQRANELTIQSSITTVHSSHLAPKCQACHQRCISTYKALLCHDNVDCKTNPRWGSGLRIMRLVVNPALWCNNKYDAIGSRHPCRNPSLPPGSSNYAAITSIINNRYPLISNPVRRASE